MPKVAVTIRILRVWRNEIMVGAETADILCSRSSDPMSRTIEGGTEYETPRGAWLAYCAAKRRGDLPPVVFVVQRRAHSTSHITNVYVAPARGLEGLRKLYQRCADALSTGAIETAALDLSKNDRPREIGRALPLAAK